VESSAQKSFNSEYAANTPAIFQPQPAALAGSLSRQPWPAASALASSL